MPAALVCELSLEHRYLPTGSQLHGLFFALLNRLDPDLAGAVHGSPERPFTLSPLLDHGGTPLDPELRSRGRRGPGLGNPSAPSTVYWRITLLDDRHAAAMVRGASQTTHELDGLMAGPTPVTVRALFLDPRAHPLAGYRTYQELVEEAYVAPAKGVRFRFLTPTTIRVRQTNLPIPEPVALFSGYARRWNAHASPVVPDEVLTAIHQGVPAPLRLSRHRIETRLFPLVPAPQIGFVGTASFDFTGTDPAVQAWLTTLASFAFFAGSGYKATMGMGLTLPSVAVS